MTENMEGVEALVVNDEVIAIEIPDTVELRDHRDRPRRPRQLRHRPDQARHPLHRRRRPGPRTPRPGRRRPRRYPDRRVPRPGDLRSYFSGTSFARPSIRARRMPSKGAA